MRVDPEARDRPTLLERPLLGRVASAFGRYGGRRRERRAAEPGRACWRARRRVGRLRFWRPFAFCTHNYGGTEKVKLSSGRV